jgi:proteasome accessory factor B
MSAARTERLLNLLTLLLNTRRPISLREIRDLAEFDAYRTEDPKSGERVFERDKAALVELGVPLHWVPPEQEEEEGQGGYLIDRERFFLPELDLAPGELALLSIAGAAAAAIEGFPGRTAVVRALAKLGFDVDESGSRVGLAHAPIREGRDPTRTAEHLQVLHDAVATRRTVHLAYEDRGGERSERDVDPWGLFYRQGIWYLVGFCHLRQAERTFHLGRVRSAALAHAEQKLPEYVVPSSFDLSAYVHGRPWELPGEPPFPVCIRVAERLVPAIPEIFGRRAELSRSADGAVVELTVCNRAALIAAVLPYGAAAEVIAPAELRRQLGTLYELLSRRYGKRRRRDTPAGRAEATP